MAKLNAIRPECMKCISNKDGVCLTLNSTNFKYECPFLATNERLEKDRQILEKAIKEGRVRANDYYI